MAPPRLFKYDVVKLMELVKERPVLWNKFTEIYKDKVERKNAWYEVCDALEPSFGDMTWEQRNSTCEYITNKWTNIRDTFLKSLKRNMKFKQKKKYLFYEHLEFLVRILEREEGFKFDSIEDPEDPSSFLKQEPNEGHIEIDIPNEASNSSPEPTSSRKSQRTRSDYYPPKKARRDSNYSTLMIDESNIDYTEMDKSESEPMRVMNEDEAFFASLLPTVVGYNEDEKLEFRIEVLGVMKKIKDKRN